MTWSTSTTLCSLLTLGLAACAALPAPGRPQAAVGDQPWSAYGGGVDSSQFSPLSQIDRGNVGAIDVAWRLALGSESTRANPIVIDGVLYTATDVAVLAVDAASGRLLWRHEHSGLRVRGVVHWSSADGTDRRILYNHGNQVLALDARNGKPVTGFAIDLREGLGRPVEKVPRAGNQTPGRIFKDLLIMGSSPGENWNSSPGDIRAFDVRTGALRWTFHTIPHPGEYGYESYPPDAWKTMGGNNNWGEMTVDVANGIVFVPLASPNYDFYGVNRPGNNLYGSSIVALNARTGKRIWHFQTVRHDIWDYDLTTAPKLLTLRRGGKRIEAVAQATKNGFIYTFERKTGRPVFPIVERPVPKSDVEGEITPPTQPVPVLPLPFAKQRFTVADLNPHLSQSERKRTLAMLSTMRNEGLFTPPSVRGTIQMPGHHGGAQYGNVAIDPQRGRLYVVSIDIPTVVKLEEPAKVARAAQAWGGAGRSGAEVYAERCAGCHQLDQSGQPPAIPPLTGIAERMTTAALAEVVRLGRGQMPAVPMTPTELNALLRYFGYVAPAAPELKGAAIGAQLHPGAAPPAAPEQSDGPDPIRYKSAYTFMFSLPGQVQSAPPWATLTAYDMNTGAQLWQVPFGESAVLLARGVKGAGDILPKGTLVATAGGLLIASTQGGQLTAWDADTGKVLLQRKLPAEAGGIPAVYSLRGRQFIAVPVAGGPSLAQMVSGNLAKATNNALVTFALPLAR